MTSGALAVVLAGGLFAHGCTNVKEAEKNREDAKTKGKYFVELTDDSERVKGTCKFLRNVNSIEDPVRIPSKSELPDYFRERAAYYGADTVLVEGAVGELYICGTAPLNPDGTRQGPYAPPRPTPHP
jgi:hypothetical protein